MCLTHFYALRAYNFFNRCNTVTNYATFLENKILYTCTKYMLIAYDRILILVKRKCFILK